VCSAHLLFDAFWTVAHCCVQCKVSLKVWNLLLLYLDYLSSFVYLARIDDNDPGFEHDRWMKKGKPTESMEELRADRWYYKNMDQLRDNPEQSGLYIILITVSST
jgi:hypothetical protein